MIRTTASLALVALTLLTAPAASAKERFALELKVTNEEGKPVEGALAQLTAASGDAFAVSGTTDRKGRFQAALPDFERPYRLQVSLAGFNTVEQLLDLPAQELKPNRTVDVAVTLRVRTAADAYNDAAKALQKRDLATGLARLEEAARMKPDFVEAWRALADDRRVRERRGAQCVLLERDPPAGTPHVPRVMKPVHARKAAPVATATHRDTRPRPASSTPAATATATPSAASNTNFSGYRAMALETIGR